eukprot:12401084-Karenia_brevis.AAC.1
MRANARQQLALAKLENVAEAKLKTHLKYVGLHQREAAYDARPGSSAKARPDEFKKQFVRMFPRQFTMTLRRWGLLRELEGVPCSNPGCYEGLGRGGQPRRLGPLRWAKNPHTLDVRKTTVWHFCQNCKARYFVSYLSILLCRVGGGVASLTDDVIAYWNCVHDAPLWTICRELGLTEPL